MLCAFTRKEPGSEGPGRGLRWQPILTPLNQTCHPWDQCFSNHNNVPSDWLLWPNPENLFWNLLNAPCPNLVAPLLVVPWCLFVCVCVFYLFRLGWVSLENMDCTCHVPIVDRKQHKFFQSQQNNKLFCVTELLVEETELISLVAPGRTGGLPMHFLCLRITTTRSLICAY